MRLLLPDRQSTHKRRSKKRSNSIFLRATIYHTQCTVSIFVRIASIVEVSTIKKNIYLHMFDSTITKNKNRPPYFGYCNAYLFNQMYFLYVFVHCLVYFPTTFLSELFFPFLTLIPYAIWIR